MNGLPQTLSCNRSVSRTMRSVFLTVIFVLTMQSASHAQVLITLLLGDKLNSDKLEFGLAGGVDFLNMSNTPDAKMLTDWNLGFYFDFKLAQKLYLHTGVRVKSKMGTGSLQPYSLNNMALDSAFSGGNVDRKINYFNVPVLIRYRLIDYLHVEGGIQLGLRYTAFDKFSNTIVEDDDLQYSNSIKDDLEHLDAGFQAGIGYKLKQGTGMTISADYYYGFVDVNKVLQGSQRNSAIYIDVSVPIGRAKAAKKEEEKAAQQQQESK